MTDKQKTPEGLYCMAGGVMTYMDDDYDWYGAGDYEVYKCTCTAGKHYVELPG